MPYVAPNEGRAIEVLDGRRIVVKCSRPAVPIRSTSSESLPRSRKHGQTAMLRQAVELALHYFNEGVEETMPELVSRARLWADRYFKGLAYARKSPLGLLKMFPSLFDLELNPCARLSRAAAPAQYFEPEGVSLRLARKMELRAMNSEPFPEYVEPTLATEEELDEIFNAQAQRPLTQQAVGVEELYQTGLMDVLPEFLSQLARIDLEAKSLLEINPQRSPQHVVAALMAQRQYCEFQTCSDDDEYATEASESVYSQTVSETCDDNDGNESDATTSTMASLRARTLKRKAAAEPDDVARPPNKVRIHVPKVPCQTIYYFDMKRGKLVSRPNPAAQTPDNNSDDLAVRPSSPNHIPPTSSSPTSSPESSFPSSPRQTPSPEFNGYPDWPAIPREVPRKRGRVIIRIKRTTSGSSRASTRESPRGEKIITFHVARRPCYSQPTSSPPSSGPNTVLSRVASPPALSYPPVPSPPRIVVKPRSRTPPRMDSISTMTDEFSDSVGGVSIVVSRRNSEFDNFEREHYAALTVPDRSGSVSSSVASAPELSSHGDGRSTKRRCVRIRVVQHGGMRQKAASSPAGF